MLETFAPFKHTLFLPHASCHNPAGAPNVQFPFDPPALQPLQWKGLVASLDQANKHMLKENTQTDKTCLFATNANLLKGYRFLGCPVSFFEQKRKHNTCMKHPHIKYMTVLVLLTHIHTVCNKNKHTHTHTHTHTQLPLQLLSETRRRDFGSCCRWPPGPAAKNWRKTFCKQGRNGLVGPKNRAHAKMACPGINGLPWAHTCRLLR